VPSLSSLLCCVSCGVLDLLRWEESPSIYRRRLEECPRNIPLLTPKTDLHSVSRYNESGSARHNRLGHVGLDQLAEDGPRQQWQGRDSALGTPCLGCRPLCPLRPVGSWLGLGSVPGVCWPICACWFGLLSIFFLFCFGPNVILCFLSLFWSIYSMFPCISCKTSEID
jgi:hypothetical protein